MDNIVNEILKEMIERYLVEGGERHDAAVGDRGAGPIEKDIEKTGELPPIHFPKFYINEAKWGTDVDTEDRSLITLIGDAMRGLEKNTPLARVRAANKFLTEINREVDTRRAIANLMFFDIFASIVNDFNASVAGFLFEGLFAGLFHGYQIPASLGGGEWGTIDVNIKVEREGGDEQLTGYSFKLLSPGGAAIGSFGDLIAGFGWKNGERYRDKEGKLTTPHQEEVYLVVYKQEGEGEEKSLTLEFNEFKINKDNWFSVVGHGDIKKVPTFETKAFSLEDPDFEPYLMKTQHKLIDGVPVALPARRHREEREAWELAEAPIVYAPRANQEGRFKKADGSPLGEERYLVVGQEYQIQSGTESQAAVANIEGSTRFITLYKDFLPGGNREEWFRKQEGSKDMDFLTYMKGPYKEDPMFFQKMSMLSAAGGGEGAKAKKFNIAAAAMNDDAAKTGEKAHLKLDRPTFVNAAQQYTDIIGHHVAAIFNSLHDLVINISSYYLSEDSSARSKYSQTAQEKAGELKDNADKYITGGSDPRQLGLFDEPEEVGSGEVLQTLEPGGMYKVGQSKKPTKADVYTLEESKQPINLDKLIEHMINKSFK